MENPHFLGLMALAEILKRESYTFTTITPASHNRVLFKKSNVSHEKDFKKTLRDIFGWNLWFKSTSVPESFLKILLDSDLVEIQEQQFKSKIRASTVKGKLFFHSGFPTEEEDSVFLGPDTYRFVRFIEAELKSCESLADLGAGAGVGGVLSTHFLETKNSPLERLYLTDVNMSALKYAEANVLINGLDTANFIKSDLFSELPTNIQSFIMNPPFILDPKNRAYRNGGALYGSELSIKAVEGFLEYSKKNKGTKQFILYTGSCFVDGVDIFYSAVEPILKEYLNSSEWKYEEIDPDIFGEELISSSYREVERIASVGLVIG